MESELRMQLDLANRIPMGNDNIPSQALPESLLRSTFYPLNCQSESMIGLPVLPSVHVEPVRDLHGDRTVNYGGPHNRADLNYHELCFEGTSLASGSLPMILAGRNAPHNDANNSVSSRQEGPSEPLKSMFPSGYSYASSFSVATSLNCGYDCMLGDVNGKWQQNRFLTQAELNWRLPASGLEPMRISENQVANEWVLPNSASANACSSHPYGTAIPHNELSLSLATCGPSLSYSTSDNRSSDSHTRFSLQQSSKGSKANSLGFASNIRSPQFSQVISGSRYLVVLEQMLSEIASYSLENVDQTSCSTNLASSTSDLRRCSDHSVDRGVVFNGGDEFHEDDGSFEARAESSYRRREMESKKSQLLSLLQAVDDRYSRCLDEIHTVISAFHAATEINPQIHSCFALQTVSFFYKNLRERISNEILAMGTNSGSVRDIGMPYDKTFIQKQWAFQQTRKKDQQLWRPQRGLPERSVSVLRQWMFDNFLHPYPKDAEKHLLAIKSGLTRSQVSNWFINARVRLWKPLVEEMCAEINRKKGGRLREEGANEGSNHRSQLSICDYNPRFTT